MRYEITSLLKKKNSHFYDNIRDKNIFKSNKFIKIISKKQLRKVNINGCFGRLWNGVMKCAPSSALFDII